MNMKIKHFNEQLNENITKINCLLTENDTEIIVSSLLKV